MSKQNTAAPVEARYPLDYKEHTRTRIENDRRLLPIAGEISSGQNVENLERFAKAYLGMYLDMDNSIPPQDRISILASTELTQLIYAGFESILKKTKVHSAEDIVNSLHTADLPEGYILLAAYDLFGKRDEYSISKLPGPTLIAITCFEYAYKNKIDKPWLHDLFLQRPAEAISAFNGFWQPLIRLNTEHLPGIYQIIGNRHHDHIARHVLLPVLENWLNVRKKLLRDILRCALRVVNSEQLARSVEKSLSSWNSAEPGRYILWLACAFLLHPEQYKHRLFSYTCRSKEKLIPLLDFVYFVLHTDSLTSLQLNAQAYADLIHILATKITPQKDRYGQLCDNTRKIMYLFLCLAVTKNKHPAIKQLAKIRVMKLYNPILKFISHYTPLSGNRSIPSLLDDFLNELNQQNLIRPKIKWYD